MAGFINSKKEGEREDGGRVGRKGGKFRRSQGGHGRVPTQKSVNGEARARCGHCMRSSGKIKRSSLNISLSFRERVII